MALDVNALRKKLNSLKSKDGKNGLIWKPQSGDNRVRIVPLKSNPANPFQELFFHYRFGGKNNYLSPITFGENDPIAEFAESLIGGGGLSKEEFKYACKFRPTARTYLPIIDRSNPDGGVKFWGFGRKIYEQLISIMTDEEWGDITDPKAGRDIKITYIAQEDSDTNFAQTEILVAPKITPLSTSPEQLKDWLTNQPDIFEFYERVDYDTLKVALDTFINGERDDRQIAAPSVKNVSDDGWGDDIDETSSVSRSTKQPKKTSAVDVEDEFAELFGQNK